MYQLAELTAGRQVQGATRVFPIDIDSGLAVMPVDVQLARRNLLQQRTRATDDAAWKSQVMQRTNTSHSEFSRLFYRRVLSRLQSTPQQ